MERIRFWDQYLVKLQSYCAARRKSAKKVPSWFPCFYILARESDPLTHRGEHAHMLVHAPNPEEAQRLIHVVNGAGKYKGWGVNILAQHADTLERFKGIKRKWALGYLLKASGMQAVRADRANWIKPSGAIAGERVRISENLTNPEVVAKTEVAVETYARVRKEKAWGQKVRLAQRRSKPSE